MESTVRKVVLSPTPHPIFFVSSHLANTLLRPQSNPFTLLEYDANCARCHRTGCHHWSRSLWSCSRKVIPQTPSTSRHTKPNAHQISTRGKHILRDHYIRAAEHCRRHMGLYTIPSKTPGICQRPFKPVFVDKPCRRRDGQPTQAQHAYV